MGSKEDDNPRTWIYHERQQAALCGQHALNNLLQRSVFSPNQLAQIAQQLDREELAMYRRGSPEYYQRLQEGSGKPHYSLFFIICQALSNFLSYNR